MVIHVRPVERFDEPAFSALQREVFAPVQDGSKAWESVLRSEERQVETDRPGLPALVRFGAFLDQELVGWTYGWFEHGSGFYMANSGVVQSHRRRGAYTLLVRAVIEMARSTGAAFVRSRHSVLNNGVLIAKLKQGFVISGLTHSAGMGALVELTYHLSPERAQMFRDRFIPLAGAGNAP